MVAYSPHILVVHPSVPVNNTKELITLAKSKPGKLNFAASSVGSAPHLAGIEFASRAGVDWAYIPYKGGAQAITDMAGGQADVMFNGMLATYPHVKSGKLKILAVSSSKRMSCDPRRADGRRGRRIGEFSDRLVARRGGAAEHTERNRCALGHRDHEDSEYARNERAARGARR